MIDNTKTEGSTTTVQHEQGKADVIADGPGTARQVPAGEGEKEAGVAKPQNPQGDGQTDGWVNGVPVDGDTQAQRDEDFAEKQAEGKAPQPDTEREAAQR